MSIQKLEIPEYITKVKVSDSKRPVYFNKYDGKGKSVKYEYSKDDLEKEKYHPIKDDYDGPPYQLPAPKTKLAKVYSGEYKWNSQGYLQEVDGDRILANPRSAGKPNYYNLSGNKFISSKNVHLRNKLKNGLKSFYKPFIESQLRPFENDEFPLGITWKIFTVPDRNGNLFDLSNLFFYRKYFEDALFDVEPPIIPDDNIEYIVYHQKYIIPVEEWEDRKFVFEFHRKDSMRNHEPWKSKFNT